MQFILPYLPSCPQCGISLNQAPDSAQQRTAFGVTELRWKIKNNFNYNYSVDLGENTKSGFTGMNSKEVVFFPSIPCHSSPPGLHSHDGSPDVFSGSQNQILPVTKTHVIFMAN